MSKAVLVIDMPKNCSKCKFMYEFYGVKKCQLLNILTNGRKAIISADILNSGRKDICPLRELPEKKECTFNDWDADCKAAGYNACIDEIMRGSEENG